MKREAWRKRSIVSLLITALFLGQSQVALASEPVVTTEIVAETEEVAEGLATPSELPVTIEENEDAQETDINASSEEDGLVESPIPDVEEELKPSESPQVSTIPEETPGAVETPEVGCFPTASVKPIETPSVSPTEIPMILPSATPEETPSAMPFASAEVTPSILPLEEPEASPSESPSSSPEVSPSASPEISPSAAPLQETEDKLFPGLEEDYKLSEEDMESKKKLQTHVASIKDMEEGVDFSANVILVYAETQELAEIYARAFGGYLEAYTYGLAIVKLNQGQSDRSISVAEAVEASADLESNLPAAWPDYICRTTSTDTGRGVMPEASYNDTWMDVTADGIGEISGYTDRGLELQWHHEKIGSELAWDADYIGEGATVAILSTGINTGADDLDFSKVECIDIGCGTTDHSNQGTHMATLIAGTAKNGIAGCGVAYGIEKIIVIDIFDNQGLSSDARVINALQKAIDAGADVICLDYYSDVYNYQVENKLEITNSKGIPVFCSAGDSASNGTSYPSAYTNSISVAALNQNNTRANFSNYGKNIRYCAPGYEIHSNDTTGSRMWYRNGTGQAAAIVAAEAAIILGSGKVGATGMWRVETLLEIMDDSCEKVSGSGMGKGMPTLTNALNLQDPAKKPDKPTFSVKSGTYTSEKMYVTINAQPGTNIYYSMDGKDVTYKNGKVSDNGWYCEPGDEIFISGATTTIKAIAVSKYGDQASSVASAKYTLKPWPNQISIKTVGYPSIAKGKSLKLKTVVTPSYAGNYTIEWKLAMSQPGVSLKNSTISVSKNSKATSVQVIASVKAKTGGYIGVTDTVVIPITEPQNPITSISVSPSKNITMNEGTNTSFSVKMKHKDGTVSTDATELAWTIEDTAIAMISDDRNFIIGESAGKTKIIGTATDGSGKSVTINVTVKKLVSSVSITGSNTLAAGKSITLNAKVKHSNAANKKLKWTVSPSGEGVSVSSSGKVSAKASASGKTFTIKAAATDGSGVYDEHTVKVTAGKMTSLKLDTKSLELFRMQNADGRGATNKEITVTTQGNSNLNCWEVTNSAPGLVSLQVDNNNGTIMVVSTGMGTGTATITVKSTDGSNLKASCKVTVSNPPTSIYISLPAGRSTELAKGKTLQLKAVIGDDAGALSSKSKKVIWESANPTDFSVDKNGKVKCNTDIGSTSIIVRTVDGTNMVASIQLTATDEMKSIELEGASNTISLPTDSTEKYSLKLTTKAGDTYRGKEVAVSVNKEGLIIRRDEYNQIYITADRVGTYKVTLSLMDGNSTKKTYTVKAW